MAFTLKLKKSKAFNPATKEHGYRTTVKANGRFGVDALVETASKNTTMHKAEVRMALELAIDAIADALKSGNTVTLPGVGTIGFSCRGAWTKTAEEQTAHDRKIGVAFYPSKDVLAAVAQAKTMWEGVSIHAPTWGATPVFSKCLNITVQSYEKCERFCGLMVK